MFYIHDKLIIYLFLLLINVIEILYFFVQNILFVLFFKKKHDLFKCVVVRNLERKKLFYSIAE